MAFFRNELKYHHGGVDPVQRTCQIDHLAIPNRYNVICDIQKHLIQSLKDIVYLAIHVIWPFFHAATLGKPARK